MVIMLRILVFGTISVSSVETVNVSLIYELQSAH